MTPLDITKALKANRDSVLWINDDRKSAAFHPGGAESYCIPVDYNDAKIAKTDPAFVIVDQTDGITFST